MAKKSPKTVFFDYFRFSKKQSMRFDQNFLQSFYTILWSFMCNFMKFAWLGCEKHSQNLSQKWPKNSRFSTFLIFAKLSVRFERNFVQSFYTKIWSLVCNFIKFVLLGCKNIAKINPKRGQQTAIFRLFHFCKNCPYDSNENFYGHFLHHRMVYVCNFDKVV